MSERTFINFLGVAVVCLGLICWVLAWKVDRLEKAIPTAKEPTE